MTYRLIPYETLEVFCRDVFVANGFTPEQSGQIVSVLLAADLCGFESHGVQRLVRYQKEIDMGWVDVRAIPETVFETPISAVLDARHAMGQLVGVQAMEMAIGKAKQSGIGIVSVRDSNHYGIAGYYTQMAVQQDLLGICMTNSEAIMVPTFGRQAMLGTNPIAVAMPADPVPFSFDAATSVVPRGKLEVYAKRGEQTPAGWMLDADGAETAAPDAVLANIIGKRGGGILPVGGYGELTGGYKGYGFGMLCEIATSILSGGMTSNHVNTVAGHTNICHGFIAMDYGLFGNKDAIREHFSIFLQELRDARKAKGQDRIYIHGEKEVESAENKRKQGIPVNDKTLQEMRDIAGRCGVDVPALFA